MPIALDRIVRFSAGAALQFGWTLKPELFEAATAWNAKVPNWLQELEGAAVNVDSVTAEHCKLRLCSAKVCATAELSHALNGSVNFALQAKRHAEGENEDGAEWSWQHDNLSGMLGGKQDAYLAVAGATGSVPVLRLRYTGAVVEVYALSAAFAQRLPPLIRALAPGELKIGELAPPNSAGQRAKRASPCSCHDA